MSSLPRLALAAVLVAGCGGSGRGTGSATSPDLRIDGCWSGPFDLDPTFFASLPAGDSQQIRLQRGDLGVSVSDGVLLDVADVREIRASRLGEPLELGLPAGVRPPGFPESARAESPPVSLSLYLYETCHAQNGALHAVGGEVTFSSLWSGDRNENDAADRLTEGSFRALLADPRQAELVDSGAGGVRVEYPPDRLSVLTGEFRYYFERGVPAQPFP